MWKYFLPLILLLLSCHVDPEEFRGLYESKTGDKITITCTGQFSSEKPFEHSNMPKEGDEVSVIVNEETYDVCFEVDNVITSFGKWDPDKRELIIQGIRYNWRKKAKCE